MTLQRMKIAETDLSAICRHLGRTPAASGTVAAAISDETVFVGAARPMTDGTPLVYGYTPRAAGALARARELLWVAATEPIRPSLALIVSGDQRNGGATAFHFSDAGEINQIPSLAVVGTGMPLFGAGLSTSGPPDDGRDSRIHPVLGDWAMDRMRSLRVGVCGCGRSGSLVGMNLARLGLSTVLVDPDILELHNLDGDFNPADVGRPKAEALADEMRRCRDGIEVEAVSTSVTSLRALRALKPVDVLFSTTDDDGAGVMTAIVSTLFLQPLIQVGIGVGIAGGDPDEFAGADIRMMIPGERCIRCFGRVAAPDQVSAVLRSHASEVEHRRRRDWRRERLGSLRSINQIAVGLATNFFLDYLAGRLRHSLWVRLTVTREGLPSLTRMNPPADPNCQLCGLRGMAEGGLRYIPAIVGSSFSDG